MHKKEIKKKFQNMHKNPDAIKELEVAENLGYLYLGSVFHTIEDCSVTCSDQSLAEGKCKRGDGHTIYDVIDGKAQIVGLVNGKVYAARENYHAVVDDLFRVGATGKTL